MFRLIRLVLATEGLAMSWRTLSSTRKLESRRESGDQTVKDAIALTPQSRVFGVPNGLTAALYFAAMVVLSAVDRGGSRRLSVGSVVMAWASLSVSAYLSYQLVFVLRRNCPLCIRAHVLNLALTTVVTAQAASSATKDR